MKSLTDRTNELLEKASLAAQAQRRKLVLRLSIAIYYYVPPIPRPLGLPKKPPKKGELKRGGIYLGWPGLTTRVEVNDAAEARHFESALLTFCELLYVYGPKAMGKKLEGLRPPK